MIKTIFIKFKKIGKKLFHFRWTRKYLSYFSKRKKIIIFSALLVIAYLSFTFLSFRSAAWQLKKLKNSWANNKICHASCAEERKQTEQIIVSVLQEKPKSDLSNLIKEEFLDQKNKLAFRIELVRLLALAFGSDKAPQYVLDYLSSPFALSKIKVAILNYFNQSSFPVTADSSTDNSPLAYYFQILQNSNDNSLRETAIYNISNYSDKGMAFSRSQLTIIKNIILDSQTKDHLRSSLIMMLADYYPFFPQETKAILESVYALAGQETIVSRLFAADTLNHLANTNLKLPEPSEAQWSEYYNN